MPRPRISPMGWSSRRARAKLAQTLVFSSRVVKQSPGARASHGRRGKGSPAAAPGPPPASVLPSLLRLGNDPDVRLRRFLAARVRLLGVGVRDSRHDDDVLPLL